MAVQEDLNVPYHQQNTDYYCGGACAQMVLASPGVGAGLLNQHALYTDNHNHGAIESGWSTPPDGLTWTMNDRRPAGFSNIFVLFALNNVDSISRKIVWTIHHYRVAPIALVFGWDHWIVVRGYDASRAPTSSGDTGYSITAFDINNPWPPCPSFYAPKGPGFPPPQPPPPHTVGDQCGTGGIGNSRGVANEHISYTTWKNTYMTGVPDFYWKGKFLAVCDPEPPAKQVGDQEPTRKYADGERILHPDEAREFAVAGLREYRLSEREDWRLVLRKTEPGEPALVQRLDLNDA